MTGDIDELLDRLDRIDRELDAALARLGDLSEDEAADLADTYRHAASLLEDYRDRATGTGDFGGYMEFRTKFSSLVEELPSDFPHRSAFEEAREEIDQRRLSDGNFDRATAALSSVADIVETLETIRSLRDERSSVRGELHDTRRSLEQRRVRLTDLASIEPDALDVPVEELQTPIDAYNDAVAEAHRSYLKSTAARDVVATYRRLSHFALLAFEPPPNDLEEYLAAHEVGAESVPTILEYLSYSRSKLSHYVEDAGRFKGELAPHGPYLDELDAAPFQIDWPPPPRREFRWQLRELVQAADRLGDQSVIEPLRELQALCRDPDRFEQLRSAARLQSELDESARDLVTSGEVHDELESIEASLEAIDEVLASDA